MVNLALISYRVEHKTICLVTNTDALYVFRVDDELKKNLGC